MIPIIEFRDIVKTFPGVKALNGISFSLDAGEVHALVGENGAGKSTLMNILGGQYSCDGGTLLLDGREIQFHSQHESLLHGIGIVYQELRLCPNLTVCENIYLGRERDAGKGQVSWTEMNRQASAILASLGASVLSTDKVEDLSVANQQLVEIARAISREARILVMDEPTSALTVKESERLFEIIAALKSKGVTIIYISHRMEEVFRISDRITVLRDGSYMGTFETATVDSKEIVNLIAGKELASELSQSVSCCIDYNEPVLEVNRLSRTGKFSEVSFTLHRQEIVGIYGLQGAGRTELLEAIFGLAPEWTGEIKAFGKPIRNRNAAEAIANGFAMVPENRRDAGIFPDMSLLENVNSAQKKAITGLLGSLKFGVMTKTCNQSLQSFNVKANSPKGLIKNLSGGNQQKVVLAKWLAIQPRILLIDEPTRGIDVGAKAEIYRIIRQLREEGLSVIIVSSELPEVLSESDRILVMKNGSLVATLLAQDATRERIIQYAL
jgi:ribose transport system ATP-binding protein